MSKLNCRVGLRGGKSTRTFSAKLTKDGAIECATSFDGDGVYDAWHNDEPVGTFEVVDGVPGKVTLHKDTGIVFGTLDLPSMSEVAKQMAKMGVFGEKQTPAEA